MSTHLRGIVPATHRISVLPALVGDRPEAYRDRWSEVVTGMHMDANIDFLTVIDDGSPALVATPVGAFEESDAIDVKAQLLAALARAPRHLVLDLSRVTAMDDTVVSAFDTVEKYASEVGCTYRLANLTPAVAAALHAHHHHAAALRGAQSANRLDAVAVARRLARRRTALHN